MEGKEIKLRLITLKVAQKDLAEKLGITAQSVSAILSAKDVRSSTIEKIAQVLNIPVSFFYDANSNHVVASGDHSAASVHGDASVSGDSDAVLKERVKSLERLVGEKERMIEEKERTIKILMQK